MSEIILQQTRVDQGLPYYNKFVDKYPRIERLASAPLDEVFKLWQGLGYYNRARNLHATANRIVNEFGGQFPTNYKEVLSLKGIGEYTASAIMSFAYNQPYASVDGNVYRILSRIFGIEEYIDTGQGKKVFQELATELLDREQAALFNQATMEFGAIQCVPSSPNCLDCPFANECFAYNNNRVTELPRKRGKIITRNRYLNYLDIRVGNQMFLKQRNQKDIWRGLYEFPLIETDKEVSFEGLCATHAYLDLMEGCSTIDVLDRYESKHILSHQVIYASIYKIKTDQFENSSFISVSHDEFDDYAVSRLIHKYME